MSMSHDFELQLGNVIALLKLNVDPGFEGSRSFNAPSDIDYHGEAPHVEDVERIQVYDEGTSKLREPTPEEVDVITTWLNSAEGRKWQGEAAEKFVEDYNDVREPDPDRAWDERFD